MNETAADQELAAVAVVGLGFLGRGIATCLLGHGFRVIGCDHSAESREAARTYIVRGLRELVELAEYDPGLLTNWQNRYHETAEVQDWPTCNFVIESIAEDATAKSEVFQQIERIVAPSTPIASNTSAIPISLLQRDRRQPDRFLGMHWAEPAHATRFLELIPGEQTSSAAIDAAMELACRCGKDPSRLAVDIPGFIVNRLAYALYREAIDLVEQGVADVETIDRSFRNACGIWANVCGPFEWMDLTGGPALYAKCMETVLPTLANDRELPDMLRRLADEGAQGAINGRGFYDWTSDEVARAHALLQNHAWRVRALMNEYFPLGDQHKCPS
jgi:3-hydroxybutyryl-CoA dehydrogenase